MLLLSGHVVERWVEHAAAESTLFYQSEEHWIVTLI